MNAVAVVDWLGRMIGYLPRDVVTAVRPWMEGLRERPIPAVVTGLMRNLSGTAVGIQVGFYAPAGSMAQRTTATDYCCEVSEGGTVYVLFECDETALIQALDAVSGGGLRVVRWGLNYRQAQNGRSYRWYVVIEGATKEEVRAVLRGMVGIPLEEELWDKLVELDAELHRVVGEREADVATRNRLEAELSAAIERLRHLETGRRDIPTGRGNEIPKIIGALLPQVIFLRDSMDVLTRGIESCEHVLGDIKGIVEERMPRRTGRVKKAHGWLKSHFNTGRRDDGRLYFKREEDRWKVLVSFKDPQKKRQGGDIEYLQGH
jgi:hypothetical protein